ncbi:uncharacterized protein EAF01_001537 [Botrytis porri]|uniref:uncharacterized protein n=1 Tax=Botrytis porri TaxID=87229 RepID=UPI0018FFFE64|nr:uncharacterized protein EAF01_001537 [Botrytis porri]KAF7912516.1 hypothetical protein EAF01_001537 [Botrytis porri]
MAPPCASRSKDDQDKPPNKKGASIEKKDASSANEPSARKTRASGQVSGSKNSTSNTTPATLPRSSKISEGPASERSQDDSGVGESSTRASNPRAATRQPIPPPVHSNKEYYNKSSRLISPDNPPVAQLHNTPSNIQARKQKRAHSPSPPKPETTEPQPLSAAVMASLAAEKAKFKEEELEAKRQYIYKYRGGGWDHQDFKEVGLRGGRLEKGAVTPTSSPVSSSQSRSDSEFTVSGDSPVEARGPIIAPASRPVEAAHSRLASEPISEHGDAPVDVDESAISAAADSVTSPSYRPLPTAGSLGNGKGKAVAVDEDEEESSEESTEDPAEDPTSDDDIADHYRDSAHTDGQSTMASSSYGPIEREAKKMPSGHVAIDEASHSRAQIFVGAPQPQALTIKIRTEKRDEHDVVTARALVTHKYTKRLDWANAKEVKCLNKWRSQILVRAFKAKHERRWKYTLSEMNALCHFLEIQLLAPGVGGLMANVDWALVTTNYNNYFRGKRQFAGELYASASYAGEDGRKTSAAGQPMKDDRDAPFRSEIALKNQIYHFRDRRAVELVRDSRGVRPRDGPEEPAGDESQEVAENIPSVTPSERSSPTSKGPLKKLIFTLGNGSKVTLENKKRDSNESQTDEEMCLPSKKTKMSGPSHLRGGSGDIWGGSESNFDYSDDAAPPTHYHSRELRSDSPFRQSSPSETARAFSNAQRVLGQGRRTDGFNKRTVISQPTSPSRSQRGSREVEENYDDDSDDEGTSFSHKANMKPHLPQVARFPPVYSQTRHLLPAIRHPLRHLLPNGPLLPAQHGSPQTAPTSNTKKRARNDGTADMGNINQQVSSKRPKLQDQEDDQDEDEGQDEQRDQYQDEHPVQHPVQFEPFAGGPNQIFLAPYPHNSSVANREAALQLRLKAPVRGPEVVTRTLGQTGPRLPTLDDYLAED